MKLQPVQTKEYQYDLPEERIAKYPLEERDHSKLLVYQGGKITHHQFYQLPDLLNHSHQLFFNNTKVIPARFLFKKETGASIEVFLLEPVLPAIMSAALNCTGRSTWLCTVGNLKRWTEGMVLQKKMGGITLEARLIDRKKCSVEFDWTPSGTTFSEIIRAAGAVPLPPYIKRAPEASDRDRYQTVYSQVEGAVAAPTAGLHFTQRVINRLHSRGIETDFLTLHVSAGTFLPMKAENALDHPMHEEQVIISRQSIELVLESGKKAVAVGTTAMRTLESLYWFGAKLLCSPLATFEIESFLPYKFGDDSPSKGDALKAVLEFMKRNKLDELAGQTSIFIIPGYRFRVCEGLITNFHQPGSTLLLLVAAFAGPDWKKIYHEALENGYRFLSYGDSSLLLP
jgi:S-adenosylmethionine:tRNA ribosyltransferase-isomerase